MSDNEAKPKKRILSPEQLEKLKAAREKALEKKRQMKELTEKEKTIKKLEEQERVKKINDKLAQLEKKPVPKPKKSKRKVVESESSESEEEESEVSESENSEEEVVVAPKRKQVSKLKNKISKKGSSELAVEVSKQELAERFKKQALQNAYNSLFGGLGGVF